ncbi:MAG: ATP-binding cassette domain-containing protein [Planctomycetota bacterium]
MIEVERLSKTFRIHKKAPGLKASLRSLFRREWTEKPAVREISFSIGEGEIVGLVGANGAGKTTLVKMLSGVITPTSGEARVLGYRPWERDNRLRSQLALIMGQKAQLWWDLPAADGFLLLKEIYRIPEADYRRNLDELSAMLGVASLLDVQVRRLSLGERMKMELIAALLHTPRVVYLDEPTIGLDLSAQRAVREFILEYRERHAPAMIVTSHYMDDIERMCERIMILRDGELVYDGSRDRILQDFARHKILIAHLHNAPSEAALEALESHGEVLEREDTKVRLKVPRGGVARAAAALLEKLSVADLTIEEIGVGSIIEELQSERAR